MLPSLTEQVGQLLPATRIAGPALNDQVIDQPTLQPAAPSPDIDLDAIFLNVRPGGQEQAPLWNSASFPSLALVRQALPVRRLAGFDPCFAEGAGR